MRQRSCRMRYRWIFLSMFIAKKSRNCKENLVVGQFPATALERSRPAADAAREANGAVYG